MLFIEPLFKCGSIRARRGRLGYADDICQLVASPSLDENVSILHYWVAEIQSWGAQEGLSFDLFKTELQHFSWGPRDTNPHLQLQTQSGTHIVSPPRRGQAIWWLGIWFDRLLNFHCHCKVMAAKAKQTAAGICSLTNTAHGVRAALLRQATIACILPVLSYGAEA